MKKEKYMAPECSVLHMAAQDVVCASATGSIEDLPEENVEW